MGAKRKRRLLIRVAATDRTFEQKELGGQPVLEGKCIHCQRKLTLAMDGTPLNGATLEHIVPKNHGGTDELENLAIACARCNAEKGLRHDHKRKNDPKLRQIVERLRARRRERLRDESETDRGRAFRKVGTVEEVAEVSALAHEIWNEHFPSIIGQAQVDYMLGKFQSRHAIDQQIREEGYEYYLVGEPEERAGYLAIVPNPDEGSLQLSKLYLRRSERGRGTGAQIMRWLEDECRARGVARLWLTVNKDNAGSIDFYRKVGFEIEESMVTDIGDGFVMDDHLMVAVVQPDPS